MAQTQRDKIKVIRIISRLNIGGPAIHTILLTEGLNKDLFETRLVIGRPDRLEGNMLDLAKRKKIEVDFIPQLRREICFGDVTVFFSILKLLWRTKPDIVHTHTAKAGTLGRLAALVAGVPVKIHTFHGHVFDGYFNPAKARLFIFIEKLLAAFTDKVIVVSESVRDQVSEKLKIFPKNKFIVIKLGLDLKDFLNNDSLKGTIRKEFNINPGVLLVGIVGRLVPIKNHKMFLKAIRKVVDSMPDRDLKFLIIGDGELRQQLEEEVKRLGLTKYVIFTGWILDIAKVYADLDIVALTSMNEGTPVSLIEAMASAKPVIATSVGGVVDIVSDGKNGLLTKPDDAGCFADAMICLLKDEKKRGELGSSGREFARNTFHKDRLIKEIEDLYHDCLNEKLKSKKTGGSKQK